MKKKKRRQDQHLLWAKTWRKGGVWKYTLPAFVLSAHCLSLHFPVAMNLLYVLNSVHILWGMKNNSYEYNRYRKFDKMPVASFVFIFDYDRSFEKKGNNMMISYLCLLLIWWKSALLFFLKHFYQPFCSF